MLLVSLGVLDLLRGLDKGVKKVAPQIEQAHFFGGLHPGEQPAIVGSAAFLRRVMKCDAKPLTAKLYLDIQWRQCSDGQQNSQQGTESNECT